MSALTDAVHANAVHDRGLTFGPPDAETYLSWAQIEQGARAAAAHLAALGAAPGDTIAILADSAGDVAPLIQGIWLRRCAFTMLQQPTPRTDLAAWLHDTLNAIKVIGARHVAVSETFAAATEPLRGAGLTVLNIADLHQSDPASGTDEAILVPEESDIAMRQLTSGSTGTPKAVDITHANLASNTAAMCTALDIDSAVDVSVSWLPLSHDMGMVGLLICPMKVGLNAVITTPQEFLRRPMMWAELIERHRGSVTGGPNFAYTVLARMLDRTLDGAVDLSSLRIAINGAEPICEGDLARFVAAAQRFGMPSSAPTAAYGMAEATLLVSLGHPRADYCADTVDAVTLAEHNHAQQRESSSTDGHTPASIRKIVSCGTAVDDTEIRIMRDQTVCKTREVGAIEVRGRAVAKSYSTAAGTQELARTDGWFDTGDLGYFDEDAQLHVCGRSKDVIIINGKNLYPTDVERAVAEVDGIRTGCVAAVRIDTPGEKEGFAVLAETHHYLDLSLLPELRHRITTRVLHTVGFPPRAIELLRPGTLPKTASGKLRRNDARNLLGRSGSLNSTMAPAAAGAHTSVASSAAE